MLSILAGRMAILLLIVIAILGVVMTIAMCMLVTVRPTRCGPAMSLTAACAVARGMLPKMYGATAHHLGDVQCHKGNGKKVSAEAHRAHSAH